MDRIIIRFTLMPIRISSVHRCTFTLIRLNIKRCTSTIISSSFRSGYPVPLTLFSSLCTGIRPYKSLVARRLPTMSQFRIESRNHRTYRRVLNATGNRRQIRIALIPDIVAIALFRFGSIQIPGLSRRAHICISVARVYRPIDCHTAIIWQIWLVRLQKHGLLPDS